MKIRLFLIAALCAAPLPLAFAGFDHRERDIGCTTKNPVSAAFLYWNVSRSIELLVVPSRHAGKAWDRCWFEKSGEPLEEPIAPGKRRKFLMKCWLPGSGGNFHFDRTATLMVSRVNAATKKTEQLEEGLRLIGDLKRKCEAVAPARAPVVPRPTDSKASCRSFRLDDPPQPFSRVAIRNQQNVGACYAAVASATFDYLRGLEGDDLSDPSSTLGSALDYKANVDSLRGPDSRKARTLDGGPEGALLELLVKDGACPDSAVRDRMRMGELTEDEANLVYGIFVDQLDSLQKEGVDPKIVEQMNVCLSDAKAEMTKQLSNRSIELCKAQPFIDLMDSVMRAQPLLACVDTLSLLKDKVRVGCDEKQRKRLKRRWKVTWHHFSPANAIDDPREVESRFFAAKTPRAVPVGIRACILKYDGATPLETFLRSKPCQDGLHAMILVGQEWNEKTRKCDAVLRNSWGQAGCGAYGAWDCDPKRGTVNVEKEALISALTDATYVSAGD